MIWELPLLTNKIIMRPQSITSKLSKFGRPLGIELERAPPRTIWRQWLYMWGDYDQAQKYLATALTILQATGNRWEEINVWNDLGIIYQELGNFSEAKRCLAEGQRLAQEIGDEIGQAYLLANIGLVALDTDDLDAAEAALSRGVTLAEKTS